MSQVMSSVEATSFVKLLLSLSFQFLLYALEEGFAWSLNLSGILHRLLVLLQCLEPSLPCLQDVVLIRFQP